MSEEPTIFAILETLAGLCTTSSPSRPPSTWGELLAYGEENSSDTNTLGLTASSQPNIFGGDNWQVNGNPAGYTTPNVFDGVDLHAPDGSLSYSTQPNIFGGFDMQHNGQIVGWSAPNVFGGVDIHSKNGQIIESSSHGTHGVDWRGQLDAHSHPNVFGGTDIDFDPNVIF